MVNIPLRQATYLGHNDTLFADIPDWEPDATNGVLLE